MQLKGAGSCYRALGSRDGAISSCSRPRLPSGVRSPFAPYRDQSPHTLKKRVSESKKPISHQNPHFPCSALYRNGDLLTQSAPFLGGGKCLLLLWNPLFLILGILAPVRGKRVPNSGGLLHMSKDGSIWQFFVLCLLALRDTVPKCYFLLQFGTPLERKNLPNGLLLPPAFWRLLMR